MYADDNRDKINGLARQFRAIANSDVLDVEDLAVVFARLREDLAAAEELAVTNLHSSGRSWTEIGRGLGTSRQAAQKRFAGRLVPDWARG